MRELIAELKEREPDYEPGQDIKEALSLKHMVMIIGPLAVGKSTCMDMIVEKESDFGRVQSFTTRPKRIGEPENSYRYLPHDPENVQKIATKIEKQELVQYAIHPTTGHIYGSEIIDYAQPYMMLDLLSSGVPQMEKLPFGKTTKTALVCPPEQWLNRLPERAQHLPGPIFLKRLTEAKISLMWSMKQGDAVHWVINRDDEAEDAAEEIVCLAKGSREPNPLNRIVGLHLLQTVEEITS